MWGTPARVGNTIGATHRDVGNTRSCREHDWCSLQTLARTCLRSSLATDHRLRTRDLRKRIGNRESGIGNRESGIGNRESGIGDEDKVLSIDGDNFRLLRSLAGLSGLGLRTSDLRPSSLDGFPPLQCGGGLGRGQTAIPRSPWNSLDLRLTPVCPLSSLPRRTGEGTHSLNASCFARGRYSPIRASLLGFFVHSRISSAKAAWQRCSTAHEDL